VTAAEIQSKDEPAAAEADVPSARKPARAAGGYDREAMADCIEAVAAHQDKAAFATLFDYFVV